MKEIFLTGRKFMLYYLHFMERMQTLYAIVDFKKTPIKFSNLYKRTVLINIIILFGYGWGEIQQMVVMNSIRHFGISVQSYPAWHKLHSIIFSAS